MLLFQIGQFAQIKRIRGYIDVHLLGVRWQVTSNPRQINSPSDSEGMIKVTSLYMLDSSRNNDIETNVAWVGMWGPSEEPRKVLERVKVQVRGGKRGEDVNMQQIKVKGEKYPMRVPNHARRAEMPTATRPTAEAATCMVDAPPLPLPPLVVVEFESEPEPEAVA